MSRQALDNAPQLPCLWCRAPEYPPNLEHIVPEGLGCPPWLVLDDGVCKSCNNGLGHIDQALVRQFEVPAFMLNLPRKKGRAPSVDGWSSLTAHHGPDGPELHLNAGPDDWTVGYRRLKRASEATGVLSHAFSVFDGVATASFGLSFGEDPKFPRALGKLALGLLAIREGHAVALDPRYDWVRRFVRHGDGDFSFLVTAGDDPLTHAFWPFWRGPNGEGPIVPIRLFGAEILMDLHPGQPGLRRFEEELGRQEEVIWQKLPLQ